MDLSEEDKFGMEKRGDPLNYPSSNFSLDWRFGGGNLTTPPTCLVPTENSIAVCKGDLLSSSSTSSISMVDPFSSSIWNQCGSENLGFCTKNSIQTSPSTSNVVASRNTGHGSLRSGVVEKVINVGWNPLNSNSILKGDVFLQTGDDILPQTLSQFPTDSAFIERAARFSCFNGGNFSNMVNPFSIADSSFPYTKGAVIQTLELPSGSGLNAVSGAQSQKNGSRVAEVVKDGMPVDHGVMEDRLVKNRGETGSFLRPSDEVKHGIGASSSESDEAEFSGSGQELSALENSVREPLANALGAKKRKRSSQDTELEQGKASPQFSVETAEESIETKQKGEQNPSSMETKTTGKHSKDTSQNLDAPKEDYIHVRARRGQATNSHSLAERVRREKISERMKFLQDLVPGCSKVTGKAVMLDEIINYVLSLQRQVEFLSMKLAAVNPWLDFNIEALLSKDTQGRTPSAIGFLPDMGMAPPQLHPWQHGLIQAGIPSIGNQSDLLRRTISSQLTSMNGYKEFAPQINSAWNDELHNIVQTSFGTNAPFNTQELNGSPTPGHMKVEL